MENNNMQTNSAAPNNLETEFSYIMELTKEEKQELLRLWANSTD